MLTFAQFNTRVEYDKMRQFCHGQVVWEPQGGGVLRLFCFTCGADYDTVEIPAEQDQQQWDIEAGIRSEYA